MHQGSHNVEKIHVGLIIALREIAHGIVIRHEYINAFIERPVLDDHLVALGNLDQILEPLSKEIGLKVIRPSRNIFIIIFQVRIICDRLESRCPAIMLGQHPGKRGLPTADISSNTNMHINEYYIFPFNSISSPSSKSSSSPGSLKGWRKGLFVLSHAMVDFPPCPGSTSVSPGRPMILSMMPTISLS